MPISNGSLKPNRKITPINEDRTQQSKEQVHSYTDSTHPDGLFEDVHEDTEKQTGNEEATTKQDEQQSKTKERPEIPKLKLHEIVCMMVPQIN